MRFNPSRARRGGVINMTSLIDMMFLLVIFILVVARFEPNAGVKVNLPGGDAPLDRPRRSMALFITSDRRLYLEEAPVALADFPGRLEALRAEIRREEGADAEPVLVIYGDRAADYGFVTELIVAARRAGQRTLDLKTSANP